MKLIIKIDMDNDAFVDCPEAEVEYILKNQVIGENLDDDTNIKLRDINGNFVGACYTEGD